MDTNEIPFAGTIARPARLGASELHVIKLQITTWSGVLAQSASGWFQLRNSLASLSNLLSGRSLNFALNTNCKPPGKLTMPTGTRRRLLDAAGARLPPPPSPPSPLTALWSVDYLDSHSDLDKSPGWLLAADELCMRGAHKAQQQRPRWRKLALSVSPPPLPSRWIGPEARLLAATASHLLA